METLLERIAADPTIIDSLTAAEVKEARQAIDELNTSLEKSDQDIDEALTADLVAFGESLTEREAAIKDDAEKRKARFQAVREAVGTDEPEAEEPSDEETEAEEVKVEETEVPADKELEAVAAAAERAERLKAARANLPAEQAPDFTEDSPATIVAASGPHQGQPVNLAQFAEIVSAHNRLQGNSRATHFTPTTLGQLHRDWGRTVTASMGAEEQRGVITDLFNDWYSPEAVVAALCAPGDTTYDVVQIGSVNGIWNVPTVNAARGALTFYPSTSPLALGLPDGTGAAESLGGGIAYAWCDSEDSPKPVLTLTCPSPTTCEVCAIVTQLRVDNFQQAFHPESVAEIFRQVAIVAERRVNYRRIQAAIAASTVTVTAADNGGGSIVETARIIAANAYGYRQNAALPRETPLDVALPYWLPGALTSDGVSRQSTVDYADQAARIEGLLSQSTINVRVQWVNDLDPLDDTGDFNDTTTAIMTGPGSFFELEGPDINIGTYRDSTLNAANQFGTFSEMTKGWCSYGGEVRVIDGIPTCPTGATGAPDDLTCNNSSVSSS